MSDQKKTILVIDDDEAILEAISLLLSSAGYTVAAYPSYTSKLLGDEKSLPDLIILDMLLSGQDGRDICRKLKADPATANMPVIMMSAHPQAERSIVEESNANDFLAKPFDARALLDMLEKYL